LLIGKRSLKLTILDSALSSSGKYQLFFGHHWVNEGSTPVLCFDVGTRNNTTDEVTRRHYKSKAEALIYWEDFRTAMLAKPQSEEKDEREKLIWLN